jgi:DNA-binding CsgD family transcriptional regulator/tetratricopeptide (TPR) repeat protein
MLDSVTTGVVSLTVVGRGDQLAALDGALAQARDGVPSAVFVGGEAGIGKTRLVSEFAERARRAGARVLAGGCLELGADGLPFAAFTSVLRQLVRDLGADGVARLLPSGGTRELARLLPEFGASQGPDDGEGAARARLFEQMLILLEQLAEQGPLALVIEDLHWADQSTRDLLVFLIRNQRSLPGGLLIVVTYRSDELHRTHPLRPMLAELGRVEWVTRIELDRLTRRDTDDLIADITGRQPGEDMLEAVYRRAEGNPLFVEALIQDGELGSSLPDSLRDLLVASVRRLPEPTQEVVRIASAGGERIGHALLAAVIGRDDAELASALRPAVYANVLLTDAEGYRFRHNLIREAVHDELLPGERSGWHSRFAEAINADPALVPPGRAAVEQAYHWYAAHDTTWALISAWQAAAESSRALAYAEQLAMLSRVLELWSQVPDAEQRIGASHLAVLEAAVQAAESAGEFDRAVALANGALKEVDIDSEPVRAALLIEARGRLKSLMGRLDYSDDLREAVRLVPADPPSAARARVLAVLADESNHRYGGRDPAEAKAYAEEALAVARQAGDAATEADALVTLACNAPLVENLEQIQDLLAQARAAANRAHAYRPLLGAAITESDLLEGLGQHEQAAAVAREGIASARSFGLARTSGATLAINLAEPLVSLGRWDEAIEVIERALDLFPPRLRMTSLWRLSADVALARGDLAAAADFAVSIREAMEGTRFKDERHLPLARLDIELRLAGPGRPAEALTAAQDALDQYNLQTSPRYGWPLLVAAARACVAARGARDEQVAAMAAALRDRLRTEAGKLEVSGPAQRAHQLTFAAEMLRAERAVAGSAGAAGSAEAVAAAGTGPGAAPGADAGPGDLRAAWDAAAQAWAAVSEPYPQASALLQAAEAALSGGDHDGGATRLRQAAGLARNLGARPLAAHIDLLARRARVDLSAGGTDGGDAAGTSRVPGTIPGTGGAAAGRGGGGIAEPDRFGLTAREFEVLRLVADGRSNPEIASELFISAKTASVHVSNILGKLGVTSRGEAAATAHRLRLFDSFPAV